MALEQLPSNSKEVVFQCMKAILNGPFIDDFEFHARLGIDRETLKSILSRWPNLDDSEDSSDESLAVNNCLNEVCYGLDISEGEWSKWFNVARTEIERVYKEWASKRARRASGIE
jgi:hypothetical protein